MVSILSQRTPNASLLTSDAVYLEYAKTSNLTAVVIYGITLIAAQSTSIGKVLRNLLFPILALAQMKAGGLWY